MTSDAELLARIEADADEIKGGPYLAAPMRALRAAAANRQAAEEAVATAVEAAKVSGATWAAIGSALGVTRQADQKRYAVKLRAHEGVFGNDKPPTDGPGVCGSYTTRDSNPEPAD